MQVRYSSSGEVSIEGSQAEMKNLSKNIQKLICSEDLVLNIELVTDFDPTPYEQAIKNLRFLKTKENSVEVKNDMLVFQGENMFFESLATNLPQSVEVTPYHVHYDSISFPEFLREESPEIVFEATH